MPGENMIYNTGTISINGNTATGTGTNWTAAASQIRVSQTIIVLSNPVQMFQINAINSGTSLTVTPAASPALSGQKYGILVTDSLSVDGLAQSMSQLINEYDENIGAWETFASTSANQLVTVTINGTSLSIPAIGGLARKGANSDITELKGLTTPLSLKQGGLGANNAADARTNLGLGSSTVKDIGTSGATVPVLNAANTWSATQTFQSGTSSTAISYGSIELYHATPFIDFHYNETQEDFNVRLYNDEDRTLTLRALGNNLAKFRVIGGYITRAGTSGSFGGNSWNINWSGNAIQMWVDGSNVGTVQMQTSSDVLLKKDITYIKAQKEALTEIMQWKPAKFKYKARGVIPESDEKYGFIANDLVTISPECIDGDGLQESYDENNPEGAYSLNETAMIAKLTLALQALRTEIDELKNESTRSLEL